MTDAVAKPVPGQGNMMDTLRRSYGLIQSLAVLALLVIVLSYLSPRFMTWINISNLMAQMSVILIVAAGMTVVMIAGELDISVGAVVALTSTTAAYLMVNYGITAGLVAGILIGPAFGILNGFIVTQFKIPSFIVTLGTSMMARSLAFVVTGGMVIAGVPAEFKIIGQGKLLDVLGFTETGAFEYLNIPLPFLIAILVYALVWVLLTRTAFGKKVYAVGANSTVAMLSGIRVARVKIACMMIVGLTASLAGLLLLSRVGASQADSGRGLEFEVIAAVVIGGTSLYGGQGNVLRTIIGVVIIVLIRNFLNLSRIDIFWQDFATGVIIITAVLLDALQKYIASRR